MSTFNQPDFTSQTATQYKANIDNSIAVLAEVGIQLAPRPTNPPTMGVMFEAGTLSTGEIIPPHLESGIGAPSVHPRIDRIYFNVALKTFLRIVGSESATPSPPAIPMGSIPLCQVHFVVGQTAILHADITDERTAVVAPVAVYDNGYSVIVDPDGLTRILIGRPGFDHRTIIRLHTDDAGSSLTVQNASGQPIFSIDGAGNVKAKGGITPNATF